MDGPTSSAGDASTPTGSASSFVTLLKTGETEQVPPPLRPPPDPLRAPAGKKGLPRTLNP
eukprot:1177864-Prorocentrum_minimum.AAC.2